MNCFAIHLGAPSIAGRPSPKNDPPDRFIGFTPAELLCGGVSPSADGNQRRCLWTPRAFVKARPKLLFRLRRALLKLLALRGAEPSSCSAEHETPRRSRARGLGTCDRGAHFEIASAKRIPLSICKRPVSAALRAGDGGNFIYYLLLISFLTGFTV